MSRERGKRVILAYRNYFQGNEIRVNFFCLIGRELGTTWLSLNWIGVRSSTNLYLRLTLTHLT